MTKTLTFLTVIFLCSCGQRDKQDNAILVPSSTKNNFQVENSTEVNTKLTSTTDYNLKFNIDSTDEDGLKMLNLYRNDKKILTHTIFKREGDCSSINIELGNYKLSENKIVFYSYWAATDRQNIAMFPFGFRKQTYLIQDSRKIIKLEAEIFIEDNIERTVGKEIYYGEHDTWKHKGLAFIYKMPQNNFEKKAKEDYIKSVEKMYNATFVFGNKKQVLEREVRKELKQEIDLYTNEWEEGEIYGAVKK